MKILISILFFLPLGIISQTVTSTCSLTDTIAKKYKNDADRLAIRRVYHINSTYQDTVKVNKAISNTYLKALVAVYNATVIPQRDTVIQFLNIHTEGLPDMNSYYIAADSTQPWMMNLRNSVFPTGNAIIDNTISRYGFHMTQYVVSAFIPYQYAVFKVDTNINSLPLTTIITPVPGVIGDGPNNFPFDGPDIYDSINPAYTLLRYSYGWGDCANGCTHRRYWDFKVYNDCSVGYIGSGGDRLPADVGIKENSAAFRNLQVYPVPAIDKITVDIMDNGHGQINLTNVFGQVVFDKPTTNIREQLDVSGLTPGIYYLTFRNNAGIKTFKILKE